MDIIRAIFQDHWLDFAAEHAGKIRPSVHKEVSRMMSCQDPENGFTLCQCPDCAKEVIVPFTCRAASAPAAASSAGTSGRKSSSRASCTVHKHLVFTLPEELRVYCRKDRSLLKDLSDQAACVLKETIREMNRGQGFEPGIISVIHTFGRDLKWNPHGNQLKNMVDSFI